MNDDARLMQSFKITRRPNYIPHGDEEDVFTAAFERKVPVILKGPTGCGKTRFVEYMSHRLGVPLLTVACHEDLSASDLIGRFLFKENETVWEDGPLTLAVRYGGICYLDEVVEARKDTVVVIHSLTDDRRMLFIDKTREVVKAHENFLLVMSYNPGYQNIVKELKESTRQRFVSILFDHPSLDVEVEIIRSETGLDRARAERLAGLGEKVRNLTGFGLAEGVSTRLLVYAARLIQSGLSGYQACRAAVTETLTDDPEVRVSLEEIVRLFFEPSPEGEGGDDAEE